MSASDPASLARDRHEVTVLLALTLATGVIDATCLLHLGVFTAYLTGSLVLFGAHLAGIPGSVIPPAAAITSFVIGAFIGVRLLRRAPATRNAVLVIGGVLVLLAALVAHLAGIQEDSGRVATIAILAFAMGTQMSVIREANVPDFALAAATVAIYNLIADPPFSADNRPATHRRLGLLTTLALGAALGAFVARWEPWAAWAVGGVILIGAAIFETVHGRRLETTAT